MREHGGQVVEHELHAAGEQIRHRQRRALVRHVLQLDALRKLEQLAGEVRDRAAAARSKLEWLRRGLGNCNQLACTGRGNRRMDYQHHRDGRHQRDRPEIARSVIRQRLVDRGGDCLAGGHPEQERVAIRRRFCNRIRADGPARTRPVLDHERLPEGARKLVGHHAREQVCCAAWGEGRDDPDRLDRIGLRKRRRRRRQSETGSRKRC